MPARSDYHDCLTCYTYTGQYAPTKCEQCLNTWLEEVIFFWIFMFFAPIFLIGKMFQMSFAWIIIGYISYHQEWNNIDLFQFVMLLTYIGLQIVLVILGIMVCRIQYWMWHIQPGIDYVKLNSDLNVSNILQSADDWYMLRTQIPLIEKLILELYGDDIGRVILDYYHNIKLYQNEQV